MAQLIVALDVERPEEAESLVDALYELDVIFKIGLESLYGYGERLLSYFSARDVRYFVDAKLHDIPRTAGAGVRALVRHGAHIINVHALGGTAMMRAAVDACASRASEIALSPPPHIFAVTILTSMDRSDLLDVGLGPDPLEDTLRLAQLAKEAGCSGVVCSAHESRIIKASLGSDFLTLTPGIRPAGAAAGDQKRVTTPADAVRNGADYLVVGRPITQANDPRAAARSILDQMREAAPAL